MPVRDRAPRRRPSPVPPGTRVRLRPRRRRRQTRSAAARSRSLRRAVTFFTGPRRTGAMGTAPGTTSCTCLLDFLHARRLALQLAQEVELGAADLGRPHDVHLLDDRRVHREDALDALAERHLAHRERWPRTPPRRRLMITPSKTWMRSLSPSLTRTCTRTVSPGLHPRPFRQLRLFHQLHRAHDLLDSLRLSSRRRAAAPARATTPRSSSSSARRLEQVGPPLHGPPQRLAAAATAESRRGARTAAHPAPDGPRTPPAACSAGSRAARA